VVCSGTDGTSQHVAAAYPTVRCIQLPHRALPGEARNAGLWAARGEYVTFPGSHVWLRAGSLRARLAAHEQGWDLVTGSVLNGNPTRAGWASYFLDHASQNPSQPAGEFHGVPGHASYVTSDVREVGGFPEDMRAGEDTVVNQELYYAGRNTYFAPDASFFHASPSTSLRHLLRHHAQRGRALGRIIREARADDPQAWPVRDIASIPVRRVRAIRTAMASADEASRARYRTVRAMVVAGAAASAGAAWLELLAPRRHPAPSDASAPARPAVGPGLPILAIGGRPGEAACGLLSAGGAHQAADRLMTFTRYGRALREVRPALAPIVTSASVTAEYKGTYTIDLEGPAVESYLDAARAVGAMLILQVQPGRAALVEIVKRWEALLSEPDVGILFDLREHVALEQQYLELADIARTVRDQHGVDTPVLARGIDADDPVIGAEFIDLRERDAPFPHVALDGATPPRALIYE
jgi:Glycosyl transferase family 2